MFLFCYVFASFYRPCLCALPSSGFSIHLLMLDGSSCVYLSAAFERITICCMSTCSKMLDFYLFWHSVSRAEVLRDALVAYLVEVESWPLAGFAVYFKLPRSRLAPSLLAALFLLK
jgi:hypothetical protein